MEEEFLEIKTSKLRSKAFQASLAKLMGLEKLPVEAMFKLRAVAKAVKSEVEDFDSVLKKLLDEAALRDEAGDPVVDKLPDGSDGVKIDSTKKAEFEEKYKELANRRSQLKSLHYQKLGSAISLLKTEDLYQLEFIVE
jgi:hypothetical protein